MSQGKSFQVKAPIIQKKEGGGGYRPRDMIIKITEMVLHTVIMFDQSVGKKNKKQDICEDISHGTEKLV